MSPVAVYHRRAEGAPGRADLEDVMGLMTNLLSEGLHLWTLRLAPPVVQLTW